MLYQLLAEEAHQRRRQHHELIRRYRLAYASLTGRRVKEPPVPEAAEEALARIVSEWTGLRSELFPQFDLAVQVPLMEAAAETLRRQPNDATLVVSSPRRLEYHGNGVC